MAYADVVAADSPVAYWPLDESSGDFIDAVGTKDFPAWTGLTRNVAELTAPLGATGAVDTDGTDGLATNTANNASFVNGTAFSWEFWCKPAVNAAKQGLLHRADLSNFGAGEQYGLNLGSDQKFEAFIQVSGGTYNTARGGLWAKDYTYHVVWIWNGTALSIIVNSEQVAAVASGRPDSAFDSIADTHWGCEVNSTPARVNRFDGVIDNIAFYDVALTRAQIQEHYDAGVERTWTAKTPKALWLGGWRK